MLKKQIGKSNLFFRKMADIEMGRESEYETDSSESEESEEEYCPGGYHPVKIGDTFCSKRYKIVSKLGFGEFSTAWKATDYNRNKEVAIKITKSRKKVREMTEDEIDIYKRIDESYTSFLKKNGDKKDSVLNGYHHLTKLIENFSVRGPNGLHFGLSFELHGSNIYSSIKKSSWVEKNNWLISRTMKQLLSAVAFLHKSSIIHTDIKVENILWLSPLMHVNNPNGLITKSILEKSEEFVNICLADMGGAILVNQRGIADDEIFQTRELRAPEMILGQTRSPKMDVWSTGCVMFEFATGKLLFNPERMKTQTKSQHHLALIEKYCGRVPTHMRDIGAFVRDFFDRKKKAKFEKEEPSSLKELLLSHDINNEKFLDLMKCQLQIDPRLRSSAEELISHPFFLEIF